MGQLGSNFRSSRRHINCVKKIFEFKRTRSQDFRNLDSRLGFEKIVNGIF